MPDSNVIIKYLKIKALAERGLPGERDNAARILKKTIADHPDIEKAAERFVKAQEAEAKRARGEPAESTRDEKPFAFGGNWEELFNFARAAATSAYDFANTVAAAYVGRQLAEEQVDVATRSSRSGNVLITFRMTLLTYNRAQQLNVVQRQAFRQTLHQMLEEELDTMLGQEDEGE